MKPVVEALARHVGVRDTALLEKDVRLHALASDIAAGPLGKKLDFKGGTCLIKCYLDYPRFSVDLDYTWRHPATWPELGPKEARRATRPARDAFRRNVTEIARRHEYRFDASEIVWASSSRMATAQLGYQDVNMEPSFIKIQVNFVEPRHHPARRVDAFSLLWGGVPQALRALDSEVLDAYARPVRLTAYDPKEILAEKCRAVLTRTVAKPRDLLDMFLIEENLGLKLEDHLAVAREKTAWGLGVAARYQRNFDGAMTRLQGLLEQDVGPLLLRPIDKGAFRAYRARAIDALKALHGDIVSRK